MMNLLEERGESTEEIKVYVTDKKVSHRGCYAIFFCIIEISTLKQMKSCGDNNTLN